MPSTIREYFIVISPIWSRFFSGDISAAKRERLLKPFRDALSNL